jgi:nucleoside 2-deoxyribosyltransferase
MKQRNSKIKIYIAGKLRTDNERDTIMRIDALCKRLGLETFVPHRDVGMAKGMEDVDKVFQGDINEGFKNCGLVIAVLDGLHVGAGTAWELGYAYAKGIPAIGIKSDEPVGEALEYLSAILIGSMKIVASLDELEKEIKNVVGDKI